jgi:group I intron endonuclease
MIGIYKITSPSNKIYIGQSVNIKNRFKQYSRLECKKQTHLYNSFLFYGVVNHKIEIIEQCLENSLNEKERYWQDFYNVIGVNGLNCKLTSTSDKTGLYSNETKMRLSISNSGRKASVGTKKKMSENRTGNKNPMFGKTHSDLTKKIILLNRDRSYKEELNPMFGKTHSKAARLKISESAKINKNRSKIVLDLNTGIYYNSLIEFVKCFNYNKYNVLKQINGHSKNKLNIIYA